MESISRAKHRDKLLISWARDLSIMNVDEIRPRWEGGAGEMARAIDLLDPVGYEKRLESHCPLYYFFQNVFFSNHPDWLYAPLHRDAMCVPIVEYLLSDDDEVRGMVMAVQRESFKSTLQHGAVPMWYAIRRHIMDGLDTRSALIHHKEQMASKNIQRISRKALVDPWLRRVWPEFCPEHGAKDFGTKFELEWPNREMTSASEPSIEAFGMTSTKTGSHYDLMIFSDATTDEHRKSRLVRTDAVDRFEALITMRDTLAGKVLYDCTFWHPSDLTQRLIKTCFPETTRPMYKSVVIGAGGTRAGKPLTMPNRHTEKFLEMRRAEILAKHGNDDFWWLQYQNEVRAASMVATDPRWIHQTEFHKLPNHMWRCIFVDPAWKGSHNAGQGDYAAIAVVAFERRGSMTNRYLLELSHSRDMTSRDGINEIYRLMSKYACINVAPEEHGGYIFRESLQEEANKRGQYINIINLKSKQTHKASRITAFLNTVQAGNFYIVKDCPGYYAFMEQYTDYPGIDHEDALDAVAYSCDPTIMENVVPVMGAMDDFETYDAYLDNPRTRYCGT